MADDDIRLELTINGDKVAIEPLDVTGEEWRVIKKASGLTVKQVMEGIADLDLEAVAALAWNTIRRTDPAATVDTVLSQLTLRSLFDAATESDDGEDDPDPSV
jgi:hypothetical protein